MTELTFAKSFLSTLDSRPLKLQSDYALNPRELSISSSYTLPKMANTMQAPSSANAKASTSTVTVILKSTRNPTLELTLPGVDAGTATILDLKGKVVKELGMDEAGRGKVKVLWDRKPVSDAKSIREVMGDPGPGAERHLTGDPGPGAERHLAGDPGPGAERKLAGDPGPGAERKLAGDPGPGAERKLAGDPGPGAERKVEFGVMIMGWKPSAAGTAGAAKAQDGSADQMDVDTEGSAQLELDESFWVDLRGFLQERLKNEEHAAEMTGLFQKSWEGR